MPKKDLTGKKVAILVDEGFEQVELIKPRKALDKAAANRIDDVREHNGNAARLLQECGHSGSGASDNDLHGS